MAETEILKKKKKKAYLLYAKEFDNVEIGETLASEDNLIIGRTIEVNLAQLTNDPKTQNIKIKFKIKEVKENKGYAELNSYFMLPTYIRRVVKTAREKLDDSFKLMTKDNINIVVKPLLLTKALTQSSILSHLRKKTREFFNDYCKKNDYKKFLDDLIMHNLQRELKEVLKKVYPLSVAEIRLMEKL
jgi:small subunit ribosomal protein S3Ae